MRSAFVPFVLLLHLSLRVTEYIFPVAGLKSSVCLELTKAGTLGGKKRGCNGSSVVY